MEDENSAYRAWPLSGIAGDKTAEALTEEADDNWFIKYDMQHIVPSTEYIKRYLAHCVRLH